MSPSNAIASLLDIQAVQKGIWRGRSLAGFGTRGFGGHLLAHAVRASNAEHPVGRPVNSLHAYFLLATNANIDIDYHVTSLKRGRAFDVDHVAARQGDRTVLDCTISYHASEPGLDYQVQMPATPSPSTLEPVVYIPPGTHAEVREPFELRYVDGRFRDQSGPEENPSLATWVRARHSPPSYEQPNHAALLAYAIDFLITRVAHMPVRNEQPVGASLDHAMWFHRPFAVDQWLLVTCTASTLSGSRSLSRAEVFDSEGHLVATAVQEALLRASPKE